MKKFFIMMMVMVAMVAHSQIITGMDANYVYLSNGTKVLYSQLPEAHYHLHSTIQECIAETAYDAYMKEAKNYRLPVGAGYSAGMYYGAGMYGVYPMYGGSGRSISIGNEHWGFSTSSSNYGGYKTSSTGVRVGSFHIGTSNAGYTSSSSYEAQKKVDSKAAAQRYSQMKAASTTSSGNGKTLHITNGGSVLLY